MREGKMIVESRWTHNCLYNQLDGNVTFHLFLLRCILSIISQKCCIITAVEAEKGMERRGAGGRGRSRTGPRKMGKGGGGKVARAYLIQCVQLSARRRQTVTGPSVEEFEK